MKFAKVMFSQVSVCPQEGMHCGGHVWQGGMHGMGHAWQGACMARGMHGRGHAWQGGMYGRGVCVAGGHAWQEGGVYGRGACMAAGACVAGRHAWQGSVPCMPLTCSQCAVVHILLECILVFSTIISFTCKHV